MSLLSHIIHATRYAQEEKRDTSLPDKSNIIIDSLGPNITSLMFRKKIESFKKMSSSCIFFVAFCKDKAAGGPLYINSHVVAQQRTI